MKAVARVPRTRRESRREETPRKLIEIEELRVDPREVQAYVDGRAQSARANEFRLLYQLALDQGRVATRDELLQKLWGRRESHRNRTVSTSSCGGCGRRSTNGRRVTPSSKRGTACGYKLEAVPE